MRATYVPPTACTRQAEPTANAGKERSALKSEWISKIMMDRQLTHADKCVAVMLLQHSNSDWEAWPSLKLLAALSCVSVSTGKLALKKLVDKEWLSVEHGRGRGNTNRYTIRFDGRFRDISTLGQIHQERREKSRPSAPLEDEKELITGPFEDAKEPIHEENRADLRAEKGRPSAPNPCIESLKEPLEGERAPVRGAGPPRASTDRPQWPPPETMPAWAELDGVSRGLGAEQLPIVWDKYRNHRLSHDKRPRDPQADWRLWCSRERQHDTAATERRRPRSGGISAGLDRALRGDFSRNATAPVIDQLAPKAKGRPAPVVERRPAPREIDRWLEARRAASDQRVAGGAGPP